MPAELADLRIDVRYIVSMSSRGQVLTGHSLLVRDGRVLEILPTALAKERYQVAAAAERGTHVLMPGLINAHAQAALSLNHLVAADAALSSDFAYDAVLRAIGAMLKSGTTCFADRCYFPADTARAAHEQGMRAVVGLPVTESASPWAQAPSEYLSRGLQLRDEYRAHPLISTAFAPLQANLLSDAVFTRLGMLVNETDAVITLDLHGSEQEIADCQVRHGQRPLQRLAALGLLSPALNAVHMNCLSPGDIDLAQRTGIAVSACGQSSVRTGGALPPLAALLGAGLRVGLGTDGAVSRSYDVWAELRLAAAMLGNGTAHPAWDTLALATCGAAAALGLDADLGTLEPGKWADLCCIDLSSPGVFAHLDPVEAALFGGVVTDVWVAGRPLLTQGELTRLDWAALNAKARSWSAMMLKAG